MQRTHGRLQAALCHWVNWFGHRGNRGARIRSARTSALDILSENGRPLTSERRGDEGIGVTDCRMSVGRTEIRGPRLHDLQPEHAGPPQRGWALLRAAPLPVADAHQLPPFYFYTFDEPGTRAELEEAAANVQPFTRAGLRTMGFFTRGKGAAGVERAVPPGDPALAAWPFEGYGKDAARWTDAALSASRAAMLARMGR